MVNILQHLLWILRKKEEYVKGSAARKTLHWKAAAPPSLEVFTATVPWLVWSHVGSGPAERSRLQDLHNSVAVFMTLQKLYLIPSKMSHMVIHIRPQSVQILVNKQSYGFKKMKITKHGSIRHEKRTIWFIKCKFSQKLRFYRSLKHAELAITYFGVPLSLKNYNDILQLLTAYLRSRKKNI